MKHYNIYTITGLTTVDIYDEKFDYLPFGYFFEKEKAINVVLNNETDLHKYYYNYIVIEEYSSGLYPNAKEIQWFKWDHKEEKWIPIKKPKEIELIGSFAIA